MDMQAEKNKEVIAVLALTSSCGIPKLFHSTKKELTCPKNHVHKKRS